jgi:5'-3' exonuclease
MGIHQLLQILKPAMKPASLSDFRGKRVAVDGNLWIHRGAYSCALELHCGQETSAYIHYCRRLANLLLDHGVRPLVVFDGANLSAKAETHAKRSAARQVAKRELDNHIESLRELELTATRRPHDSELQHAIGELRSRVERAAQTTIKVTATMVERAWR